jgi:hypothetical protein
MSKRITAQMFLFFTYIFKGLQNLNIHETQIIYKSLTKRCFNNISCHGFEFAMSYRTLPRFVNDSLTKHTFKIFNTSKSQYVVILSA